MTRLFAPLLLLAATLFAAPAAAARCEGPAAVCTEAQEGAMVLAGGGRAVAILVDGDVEPGAVRAARDLAADFGRVTGTPAGVLTEAPREAEALVIVGTFGRSPTVDRLVREGRLDASGVAGVWEGYLHQLVERPAPGIARALVIAGADKRGTIFGAYDLSQRIGVSPWHWWADVPAARREALWVTPGRRAEHPAVRYRGIFINDEEPAQATGRAGRSAASTPASTSACSS